MNSAAVQLCTTAQNTLTLDVKSTERDADLSPVARVLSPRVPHVAVSAPILHNWKED